MVAVTHHTYPGRIFGMVSVLKVIIFVGMLVGSTRMLAGRWNWWAGWAFLGVFMLYSLVLFGWLAQVDPDLVHERQREAYSLNAPYERVILPLMGFA